MGKIIMKVDYGGVRKDPCNKYLHVPHLICKLMVVSSNEIRFPPIGTDTEFIDTINYYPPEDVLELMYQSVSGHQYEVSVPHFMAEGRADHSDVGIRLAQFIPALTHGEVEDKPYCVPGALEKFQEAVITAHNIYCDNGYKMEFDPESGLTYVVLYNSVRVHGKKAYLDFLFVHPERSFNATLEYDTNNYSGITLTLPTKIFDHPQEFTPRPNNMNYYHMIKWIYDEIDNAIEYVFNRLKEYYLNDVLVLVDYMRNSTAVNYFANYAATTLGITE